MKKVNIDDKYDKTDVIEDSMHGKLEYTLMNDFLAKYSLQNNTFALGGLLAALLRLDVNDIRDIQILNPIKPSEVIREKLCVLDINLELNNSKIINIEIQTTYQEFWPERSITYLSRNFNQLKEGDHYIQIKPCIHIGILSKNLFKEDDPRYTDEFYSEYELLNTKTHTVYSDKFSIRVLSLEQLENASEEDKQDKNGLYYWAKLFAATSWEELKMTAQDNPRMESFVGTIRELTADEKIAQACENRRMYSIEKATYEYSVNKAKQELEDTNKELENTNRKLGETKQELGETKQELEDTKQELDAANKELERLRSLLAGSGAK